MIQSFADSVTAKVWNRDKVKPLAQDLRRIAHRKLRQLNAADRLDDLRVPPRNRLEKLVGDRAGQHSIRVNDHYRICFPWTKHGPKDVELVDYH